MRSGMLPPPLLAALVLAACGDGAELTVTQTIPWTGPLTCAERAAFAPSLEATLYVGGNFPPCAMTVDPTTLAVTGTCSGYRPGTARPLLLAYELGAATTTYVSFFIGYVDLCNLADDADRVSVTFSDDEVSGAFVFLPADIAALPTDDPPLSTCGDGLLEAKMWAQNQLTEASSSLVRAQGRYSNEGALLPVSLDADEDCGTSSACSNLEEACAGTLDY